MGDAVFCDDAVIFMSPLLTADYCRAAECTARESPDTGILELLRRCSGPVAICRR